MKRIEGRMIEGRKMIASEGNNCGRGYSGICYVIYKIYTVNNGNVIT